MNYELIILCTVYSTYSIWWFFCLVLFLAVHIYTVYSIEYIFTVCVYTIFTYTVSMYRTVLCIFYYVLSLFTIYHYRKKKPTQRNAFFKNVQYTVHVTRRILEIQRNKFDFQEQYLVFTVLTHFQKKKDWEMKC